MTKSRSFSIYLLRKGLDSTNSLTENTKLESMPVGQQLPADAALYILDAPPTEPWWKSYFGITKPLLQGHKGALLFLPAGGRTFALSFGNVYSNLKDDAYEYDFGLRVTLNSLDPNKLRSTDTVQPGASQRRRTQVPRESDLTFFDFDQDSTILKSLTGKVREELKPLFKQATGSSSLKISSDTAPGGIAAILAKLVELYESEDFTTTFPEIQNIKPIRDPSLRSELDVKLKSAIGARDPAIILAPPEIINYTDNTYVTFTGYGAGLIYDDIQMSSFYEYADSKGIDLESTDLKDFKKFSLIITNEAEIPLDKFGIYRCLFFVVKLEGSENEYHLVEGSWYEVSDSYLKRLQDFIDPFFVASNLPAYTDANEGDYNTRATDECTPAICLDKKNISPEGQKQVEPCDILRKHDDRLEMIHVKRSTLSGSLSHLFNQGANSCELLRLEPDSRQNLADLINELAGDLAGDYLALADAGSLSVKYAIITHKDIEKKSESLPLFSRISLMRNLRALRAMGFPTSCCYIEDASEKKDGKKKTRKKKETAEAEE